MNCLKHPDVAAVTACQECNMGMCAECVKNKVNMANGQTLCNSCAAKNVSAYVEVLKVEMAALDKRFKVTTGVVIFFVVFFLLPAVVGGLSGQSGVLTGVIVSIILCFAIGSYTIAPKEEKTAEQKSLDRLNMTMWLQSQHAGAFMLGGVLGWLIRSCLFPFVYATFCSNYKKAKAEVTHTIAEHEKLLEYLQAA